MRERIDLPVDVIQTMVRYLDQFPLWSKEIDVLGQVYEKFLVKTMTGQELGQSQMLKHYSHIRRQALNLAAAALEPSFVRPQTATVELIN